MQRLKPAEIRASSHAETAAGKEEGGPSGAQPTRRPRSLPGPRLELQLRSAPTQAKGAGPQGIGQRPPPLAKTLLCPPRIAGSSRSEAWVPERGVNCLRESLASQLHLVAIGGHIGPTQGLRGCVAWVLASSPSLCGLSLRTLLPPPSRLAQA